MGEDQGFIAGRFGDIGHYFIVRTMQLEEFCQRSKTTGTFTSDADWSLLNHVAMEEGLSGIVGRKVDLVSQRAIERSSNWIRGPLVCLAMTRICSISSGPRAWQSSSKDHRVMRNSSGPYEC